MSGPVRVYQPQFTVPVLQALRAQRLDVSSGLDRAAQVAGEFEQRRTVRKINEARLSAATQLEDLQLEAEKQPWDQRTKFFEEGAARIRSTLDKGFGFLDGEAKSGFASDWGQLVTPRSIEVKHSARKGEILHNVAVLDESLTTFARQAAQAKSEPEATALKEQAAFAIADAQAGGFLTEVEAGDRTRDFARGVEKNRAVSLINANPSLGLKALEDTSKFQNLREEDRLALVGRAEQKIQHQAAMADHAAAVAERNRRLMGDQIAKEGFDLLAKGQMTEEWMTTNRRVLDTSDYRMLRDGMQEGGGADSADALADLYQKVYIDGVDASPDIIAKMRTRSINPGTAKALLDENKGSTPVKRAKAFITAYLKPSDINPAPGAPQAFAEAMAEFDRLYAADPRQDADELARKVVQRNAIADFSKMTVVMPLPTYAVGTRQALDVKASRAATVKAFLAKHGGDKTKMNADPNYIRELRALKQWEDAQNRLNAAEAATKAGAKPK